MSRNERLLNRALETLDSLDVEGGADSVAVPEDLCAIGDIQAVDRPYYDTA